jgi:hypothetical protein
MIRKALILICLGLAALPGFSQRVRMPDLLHYLTVSVSEFEHCMLRQGFTCYQSSGNLWGWTCLFAYQPIPFLTPPEQAPALIQFTCSARSNVVTYQLRSSGQYRLLQKELLALGYQMQATPRQGCLFSRGSTLISCQKTDKCNAISGNYQGYNLTLVRQRY